MKIYLNGKYVSDQDAKIEHNNRGFLLGDGIFETIRTYDGSLFFLEDHYERLKNSANYLEIPFNLNLNDLKNILTTLLYENGFQEENAILRLTLTRGIGQRGILPPLEVNPTVMITAFPLPFSARRESLKVMISHIKRNEYSPSSNIKSLGYLDNIIARNIAVKKGFDDCVLLNTKGNIACASVANIFIVTDKGISTPRVDDGILPGITRKIVIHICKENNIALFEEPIGELDLLGAKEIFFTNSLIELQPVVQVNSQEINGGKVGEVTLSLQAFYKNKL